MLSESQSKQFVHVLLEWHEDNPRPMPWLEEDDPYRIWLSEIILQQTQVSQGVPYYQKFVTRYPTVADLASADEGSILKDWQGLGYNSRARNMHTAAKQVVSDYGGIFPKTRNELLNLAGVGPYTAAAIASFAYGERVAAIDSNVTRVVCRYLGISDIPGTPKTRRLLHRILSRMIEHADPAVFNQAIMNFGALCCTPRNPSCSWCPFAENCVAYRDNLIAEIPARAPQKQRRSRYLHYFVLVSADGLVLRQRTGKDIWRGMYDFPAIETAGPGALRITKRQKFVRQVASGEVLLARRVTRNQQILTHQRIHGIFYTFTIENLRETLKDEEYQFVEFGNLGNFAVPKIIDCYLRANFDTFINT